MDRKVKIRLIFDGSKKSYIIKVLERFRMEKCSANIVPMQCRKNELECKQMDKLLVHLSLGA